MKYLFLLIFFCFTKVYAQKNLVLEESGELIKTAFDYQQNDEHQKAIDVYSKVSINDTNYAVAQYEIGRSSIELNRLTEGRKILYNLLNNYSRFDFQPDVYNLIGYSHLREKDSLTAIKIYSEGIAKYPMNYLLFFNRGLAYEKVGKYDLALEDYKSSIKRNIYYTQAHIQLGILAANEEHYTEATMALATYFILDPTGEKASGVTKFLEEMSNGSFNPKSKGLKISQLEQFESLNLLFKNKVALDKKYKVKFTYPTDFGKQLHLICSSISFNENDLDFWNQMYTPLYKEIFEKDKLDEFVMLSLVNIENEQIQKKLKSKVGQLKAFIEWISPVYNNHFSIQYMDYEGAPKKVNMSYEDSRLSYFGPVNNQGNAEGKFYHYHKNGALMLISNYVNDDASGEFKFYSDEDGKLEKKFTFDVQNNTKIEEYYYTTGEISSRYLFRNQELVDSVTFYYRNGTIKEVVAVNNGERNGELFQYFPNGTREYKGVYKDGNANGDFEMFHRNGKLKSTFKYANDILEGKRTTYFPDGTIETVYNFKNGKYDGPFEEYFPNGKLSEKGTYKNGMSIGDLTFYYSDGNISSKINLDDNGKENGTSTFYARDQKKYHEIDYTSGEVKEVRFYDKSGNMTLLSKKKGKTVDYVFNFPAGNREVEGKFIDGKKEGNWTYYDYYGNIIKTETYKDNEVQGDVLYYHPNGQIKMKYSVIDGVENGVYLEYGIFGNLIEEGFYLDGEKDREWFVYYPDGTIEDENYFVNGELNGFQISRSINGKMESIQEYNTGLEINHEFLDTNELVIDKIGEFNGEVKLHSPTNSYVQYVGNYINGENNGATYSYSPDNKVIAHGQFENNLRTGKWTWNYLVNGQVFEVCNYLNGQLNGQDIEYYSNGKMKSIENYIYGEAQGEFKYFYEDGSIKLEGTFLDSKRNGVVTSYGVEGGITLIRHYEMGVIKSYSYLGKDGKPVPPIPIKKEAESMITYHKNGNVAVKCNRVSGLLDGEYEIFYQNGQIYERESYKFDELNGISTTFYPNGTHKEEAVYFQGTLHGVKRTFHSNGKVKSEQTFRYGIPHGEKKEFSSEGKLLVTILYYDGDVISIN